MQEELSATLATHQDQTLFESHGCFPINTMLATRYKALGRGTGLGIGNDGDPQYTITKGHEHAVAYSVGDVPDTAFANAGDTVARTLTARADGSPIVAGMATVQACPKYALHAALWWLAIKSKEVEQ